MAEITRETILQALGGVRKTDGGQDVVSLGMITGVVVRDGNVGFAVEVDASEGEASEPLRQECEAAVEAVPGVLSVTAVLTAERPAQRGAPSHRARAASANPRQRSILPSPWLPTAYAAGCSIAMFSDPPSPE